MSLVQCVECKKEISDRAKSCPNCGAPLAKPKKKNTGTLIFILLAILVIGFAVIALTGESGGASANVEELCSQSAEAAHYIAAESVSAEDVNRVVGDVVAKRKYPLLDDKMVASIGGIVIVSRGTYTPDEVSQKVEETCERTVADHKQQ